jgi:outer membrane immunogenic protein
MNKLLLTGLAFTALAAGPAMAADMPVKARAVPVAVASWTGLYVGINGGGAVSQVCGTVLPPAVAGGLALTGGLATDLGCAYATGAFGGAQVGFNWQAGSWVFGVEATGDWGNLDGANTFLAPNTGFRGSDRVRSFAQANARLGYLVSPTVLLYVKGGGGWVRNEYTVASTAAPFAVVATASENRSGWVGGAGFEYMWLPNVTIGIDYTYMGLGTKNVTFTTVAGLAGDTVAISQNLQALTVKLNYKFWGM